MPEERFLVTGGTGCIGAWVVKNLIQESIPVVVLTVDDYFQRLKLILSNKEFEKIQFVIGDISDVHTLVELAQKHRINRVIHLAGLQLPFCKANPSVGAAVNVVGTINIFEMARQAGIERVVYASSAAVYGPKDYYKQDVLDCDAPFFPTSHYGVYKIANEQNAQVYWHDNSISSIGLRPHTVYGPGRDQGMTSKPTVAMIAAAANRKYHINFNGRYQFQYADDVAKVFLKAARVQFTGAKACSIGGKATKVEEIVRLIEKVDPTSRELISFDDKPLALPEQFDNSEMIQILGKYDEIPMEQGVEQTLAYYRNAIKCGILDEAYLQKVLSY
jgi:UDP-glucuronate 4-epimerase